MNDVKTQTQAFLARFFPSDTIGDDEDFFALGFVNSLFAIQLVLFVEREFGITVENEDLDIDNFRSIDAIVRLVGRKAAPVAAA